MDGEEHRLPTPQRSARARALQALASALVRAEVDGAWYSIAALASASSGPAAVEKAGGAPAAVVCMVTRGAASQA
jgi:hypothetical protein